MIEDTGATVGYKAWMPVDGGGSETIDITLPLGADDDLLNQAIQQWYRLRDKALPALKNVTQAAVVQANAQANLPAAEQKLPFGKYKGCTLAWIYTNDKGYLEWLAYKSDPGRTEQVWRERADEVMRNPPGATFEGDAGESDDLPF